MIRARAAALGAFLALLVACTGIPAGPGRAPTPAPRPSAPPIVDNATADLAHKVEQQKIEEALQQALAEIKAHQEEVQRSIQSWAYGLGMAIAGLGVFLAIVGFWIKPVQPAGIALAVSGFLILVFSKAVSNFGDSMAAIVAIGLAVVLSGGLVWLLARLYQAAKAARELVKTGEEAKQEMTPDVRERVFGEGGIADAIQSPTTRRVVQKIRTKLERNQP